MNYYPHHIGDFNSSTRHLTRMERGIFRDMLDLYYEKESPLPSDQRTLFRRLLIVTPDEIEAATQVLADFFVLTDAGWINARCEKEISEYRAGQRNANAGARARAWQAVEKRLATDIAGTNYLMAEQRLLEFVRQYGGSPETDAQAERITSLKQPPQGGFDFDAAGMGFMSSGGSAGVPAFEPEAHRGSIADSPRIDRDLSAHESRINRGSIADDARMPIADPNQNQNQNQNQNHYTPPAQPTQIGDCARGAVGLSVEFRKHGVMTQPANPVLLEMASQGVTPETVAAACEEARKTKPGSLNLGYVRGILERWSREAGAMNVAGARQQARQQPNNLTATRMATIAELTGGSSHVAADNIIDITPSADTAQLG